MSIEPAAIYGMWHATLLRMQWVKSHDRGKSAEIFRSLVFTIALIERAVALPPIDQANTKNLLAAIFATGDAMALQGVNFQNWAASSRDVWR